MPKTKLKAPMTPAREELEQKKLSTAIYRGHGLGGSLDKIIDLADVIYATNVAAALDVLLPKKPGE